MKYNINLNQKMLIELSPEITLSEAVILDYLYFICNSLNEKIQKQRVDGYTWINYKTLLEDLPLLKGRTTTTLTSKINNLEKFGYIKTKIVSTETGKYKYIKLQNKIDLIYFSPHDSAIRKTKLGHQENLINNYTSDNTSISKDIDYSVLTSSETPSHKSNSTLLQDSCFEDDFVKQGDSSAYVRDCKPPEEKEKTIYEDLLDYWNQKEILVHRKLSPLVKKHCDKLLKNGMTIFEIKKAIDNYSEILEDRTCLFKYKWALHEFLQREGGAQTFIDKTVDDYKIKQKY